jgi:hypothetical protein
MSPATSRWLSVFLGTEGIGTCRFGEPWSLLLRVTLCVSTPQSARRPTPSTHVNRRRCDEGSRSLACGALDLAQIHYPTPFPAFLCFLTWVPSLACISLKAFVALCAGQRHLHTESGRRGLQFLTRQSNSKNSRYHIMRSPSTIQSASDFF